MEHLPLPNDSVGFGNEKIILLSEEEYDGGSFLTYPLRKNQSYMIPLLGDVSQIDTQPLHQLPLKEVEAFFQTWLFFGLLKEVLRDSYRSEDFVAHAEVNLLAVRVLSTSKLLGLIDSWISTTSSSPELAELTFYNHISKCLWLVMRLLRIVPNEFNASLKYTIASIAELIGFAACKAFKVRPINNTCPRVWTLNFNDIRKERQMLTAGWCRAEIKLCLHLFKSLQTFHFLSRMGRPEPGERHLSCSDERCEACQISKSQYRTLHLTDGCSCDAYVTDLLALDRILARGSLPLLQVKTANSLDKISVDVVEAQADSKYVALSHVWADGLGNPYANTLPRCQLWHISNLAAAVGRESGSAGADGRSLIWLDTLCCPVQPDEAHKRALAQMRRTYEQATHVLVLDASLQPYDSRSLSEVEMCARILTSRWMRRVWTLQEGSFAKQLWFQFQDRAIELRVIKSALYKISATEIGWKGLVLDLLINTHGLTVFSPNRISSDRDPSPGVGNLLQALEHRSVSVPSDEPLLIGNLMHLDIEKILQSPADLRMQTMWSLLWSVPRGIPQNILFRTGSKLSAIKGYRWAPATLLIPSDPSNAAINTLSSDRYPAMPSAHGLWVHLPGYILSIPKPQVGFPDNGWSFSDKSNDIEMYMRDSNGTWYTALPISHPSPSVEDNNRERSPFNEITQGHPRSHAILLASQFSPHIQGTSQRRNALLAQIQHCHDDGVLHVQSRIQLRFIMVGSQSELLESSYQCAQKLLHDNNTLTDDDAIDTKAEKINDNHQANPYQQLKRRILIASAEYINAESADKGYGSWLFESMVERMYLGRYCLIDSVLPADQQWCVD
ncbi:hypothetical protein MMC31_001470 [Peltigera leucophlebia]|nr:hypothetical protein [Peltigera leucophlebia]